MLLYLKCETRFYFVLFFACTIVLWIDLDGVLSFFLSFEMRQNVCIIYSLMRKFQILDKIFFKHKSSTQKVLALFLLEGGG